MYAAQASVARHQATLESVYLKRKAENVTASVVYLAGSRQLAECLRVVQLAAGSWQQGASCMR